MSRRARSLLFRLAHPFKPRFQCPICAYRGPFRDLQAQTGLRRHAVCPACGALERHRLQHLVLRQVLAGRAAASMRMLHFAPESAFGTRFRQEFAAYESADIEMPGVDHRVDLQALPFLPDSYDIVYASHVLEHVRDDARAIAEIHRILRPGGIAILPVPIVNPVTVEYDQPNPHEAMHVRAPGPDYFDRLRRQFARVEVFSSEGFDEVHQTYIHGDRSRYPTAESPHLSPTPGLRHPDYVPVCWK